MALSEQEVVRRNSLDRLRSLGIEPYPSHAFNTTHTVTEVLNNFDALEGVSVVLAGE